MTVMPLAMEKVGEPIVNESERISSDVNDMERNFDPAKPFTFEVEYETTPPIVWKMDIKETQVVIQDNGDLSTDVAATEELIKGWRKQKGGFQRVVVGRGLEKGDTCIMDLDIRGKGMKASLPGMKKQRFPFDTDMDPLGLVQGMVGMKVGDERTFEITFPSGGFSPDSYYMAQGALRGSKGLSGGGGWRMIPFLVTVSDTAPPSECSGMPILNEEKCVLTLNAFF